MTALAFQPDTDYVGPINPATKLPHTLVYLRANGLEPSPTRGDRRRERKAPREVEIHGPFRATDTKTPDGWEVVSTGYGNATRVACWEPSRDKARAKARELNASGATVTRTLPAA